MNKIQQIIDDNNILVLREDIKEEFKINGLFIDVANKPIIVLNKKLSDRKEELTLAEEVAHFCVGVTPTLPFANDYYNKLVRSKNEFKAFKWLQGNLLPLGVENSKNDTIWDLSDRFQLPVEFVEKVIEYRKENYNGCSSY